MKSNKANSKYKLKCLKGAMYIDTIIGMYVTCIIIALGLAILPVIIGQYMLSAEVNSLARDIAITGEYNNSTTITINGRTVTPTVTLIEGNSNNYRYQLGSKFKVEANLIINVNIGGIAHTDIPLKASATGRSETYWNNIPLN